MERVTALQALSGASRRLGAALGAADLQSQHRALETAVHFLDSVITAVSDVYLSGPSPSPPGESPAPPYCRCSCQITSTRLF